MAFAKLPRLPLNVPLVVLRDASGAVTGKGYASTEMQRWWQTVCERIEAQEGAQDATIEALAAALALITAAQVAADDAQTAATAAAASAATAQSAADDVASNSSLILGYVDPASILTATDAGANATITIAGHNRIYGNGTTVAVTGAALTALAYSTSYAVYYDDLARAGGAVTYHATTDPIVAAADIVTGRHFVGLVVTPAALGVPNDGIGAVPSGFMPPTGFIFP